MLESIINLQQFSNPVNILLSIVLAYRLYTLLPSFRFNELNVDENDQTNLKATLPEHTAEYHKRPTKFPETRVWRTYTPLELKHFDGNNGSKILFAVNRVVYDVSSGRNFYGPDGPYGNFAGRDASRGLAKQSFDDSILTPIDSTLDKLDDLTDEERENLKGWEDLFKSKYIACGELIENSDRPQKAL
ncbi:hypothetical protein PTTG_06912 [Puccinia triticina 1-1 BBBD Race 1]|uniref:Cytochrome b5 heme-binding domain-containing protein n=2 Tax=Puccinia triticina TaxID=208348 RepID=A0A0C4F1E2_PUCT1|nr:uncharacterized protein PtA15_13A406 [Puccinia triticina]OAV89152.1 hypothetical protein PTTG_06912 [Puccinia triticina 1-1 BBBD Race 1]WAQ91006.1 hypothetical protein PtA15_13A406 [Puccinia triticina]WAR61197.1 hypothetical protein PtB15_13B449 [Puccinia triticina]